MLDIKPHYSIIKLFVIVSGILVIFASIPIANIFYTRYKLISFDRQMVIDLLMKKEWNDTDRSLLQAIEADGIDICPQKLGVMPLPMSLCATSVPWLFPLGFWELDYSGSTEWHFGD
jgi:hypothetical protein